MAHMKNQYNRHWVWLGLAPLILSLLLNSQAAVTALNEPYDSLRYVGMAETLLDGQWLGPYDHMTLIRPPVYALMIAANGFLGLPLHVVQQGIYLLSFILLAAALMDLGVSGTRVFLLLVLAAFHPAGLIPPSFVATEPLYVPATAAVLAGCIGIIGAATASRMRYAGWCSILAAVLPVFWYTRPEGFWILPTLFVAAVCLIYRMVAVQMLSLKRITAAVLMPLLTVWLAGSLMARQNLAHYGVPVVHELAEPGFKDALRQLTRVEPDARRSFVPVTFQAMATAAGISPHFAQLMPYLSGQTHGQGWSRGGCEWMGICDELVGGWSMWAIRDAAATVGIFNSGPKSAAFFQSMAEEVREACLSGLIPCSANQTGNLLAPPVTLSDIPRIAASAARMLVLALTFGDLHRTLQDLFLSGEPSLIDRYAALTHDPGPHGANAMKAHHLAVLVFRWFQIALGLAIIPLLAYRITRGPLDNGLWALIVCCLALIVSRVLFIGYLDAISFKAQWRYLLPVYPSLLALTVTLPHPRSLLQKHQPPGPDRWVG
jgi:hypothetical protein